MQSNLTDDQIITILRYVSWNIEELSMFKNENEMLIVTGVKFNTAIA